MRLVSPWLIVTAVGITATASIFHSPFLRILAPLRLFAKVGIVLSVLRDFFELARLVVPHALAIRVIAARMVVCKH